MAEKISSAVVQETISQILTGLIENYGGKGKPEAHEDVERLELAHIKLEAALEISNKWLITDASLLRWRKKLRCAAQECDDTLHKFKQRALEEEQMEQEVRSSSLPKRIAHATKSFVFSNLNHNKCRKSIVRRFEWFADGASEFLRFIELGGTPRRHMPFDSLVKHLFAGKELHHRSVRGNDHPSFLMWLTPFRTDNAGIEVTLKIIQKYSNAPENNFFLGVMLQISESTDIVGIVIKCLQLFPPHFQSTVENIEEELTQLPTQDFSWVPYVDLFERQHWDNLHGFSTQWFRPDPLCCKKQDQHTSNLGMSGLPDVSLEPVIEVNLQCQFMCSNYKKRRTSSLSECKNSRQDAPHLTAGLLYTPHGSSEDMLLPANETSAVARIYGDEQHCLHTGITFEELKETMIPKAIDYFQQNIEATVYQMLWKSKHGTAYIQIEKAGMEMPSAQRSRRARKRDQLVQLHDQELGSRTHMVAQFLNSWVAHAPIHLRGSVLNWIQNEKRRQLAAPLLHL